MVPVTYLPFTKSHFLKIPPPLNIAALGTTLPTHKPLRYNHSIIRVKLIILVFSRAHNPESFESNLGELGEAFYRPDLGMY